MITFYVTSPYWENDCNDLLDLRHKSEEDLCMLIVRNPNGILKVVPHGEDSVFKRIFMRLDDDGYPIEGIYKTMLNQSEIEYRIVENINMIRYRERILVNKKKQ